MRTRNTKSSLLVLMLAATLAGCSDNEKKKPTPKAEAVKQWNGARAGVLGSLAKDQYESGNFDKARKTLTDAIALSPDNPGLRVLSARVYIEQSQIERAEAELKAARQLDPKNPEADYLSGVVYQRWQKPDVALEFYSAASEKEPNELAYLLARSEMLVALDRGPEALRLLRDRVIYFENSAAIRDVVGQLLVQQKQYSDAVAMFKSASILQPEDQGIRERLGLAQYYAKDYGDAIVTLTRLTASERFARRADLIAAIGACQFELAHYREARDAFDAAAQIESGSAGIWLGHAKAVLQLGDFRRCDLSLKKALAIEPDNAEANLVLGSMRLRQNRLQDALAAFQRASAANPQDAFSLCMVGYAMEKLHRNDEAIKYYGRALKIKPNDELAAQLMAGIAE